VEHILLGLLLEERVSLCPQLYAKDLVEARDGIIKTLLEVVILLLAHMAHLVGAAAVRLI
jgi:hypothetical protein